MNSTEICKLCTGTFVIAFAFAASSEALAAKPIQRDDLRAPEIVEIQNDKNVYRVGDRVWSLYYITKDGVVVIDPCGKRIAERMAQLIKEKTNLPVKYVIYSHNHWDHIAGAKVFKDQGATIIAHELAAKNIREGNPDVVAPDWIWAGDKKTLSIGGQDIEMTYFGYKSHGEGNVVIKLKETNGVYTADSFVPDRMLFQYVADGISHRYLRYRQDMMKMDFSKIYTVHVRTLATREDLQNSINFITDLRNETKRVLKSGVSGFDAPYKVQLPQWSHLLMYKEWLPLNVMKVVQEETLGY